jgi:hypothetical protein
MVAITWHTNGLDQPLLAEMPQVARSGIGRPLAMVRQITTRDNPKRTDGRERPRFRAAQGVLAVAIANDLTLESSWQIEITCERVARVVVALTCVTVALRSASGVIAIVRLWRSIGSATPVDSTALVVAVMVARIEVQHTHLPGVAKFKVWARARKPRRGRGLPV